MSDGVTSNEEVLKVLRKIKRWHFKPLLVDMEEGLASARSLPPFHALAFDRVVLVSQGPLSDPIRVSTASVPDAYFMSTVSLGEAVDQIAERVGASADLAPFRGWEVNLLAPGEAFETEFEPDGIAAFVSSKKMDGAYFDFVVYNSTDVANYSTKTAVPGLKHSGDVGSLLHFVRASRALLEDSPFVLGVVGYNVRMLRLFSNQLPAVCIPDPGTRTIHIVPCPLDEASIHDNTMACLVTGMRRGSRIRWGLHLVPVALVGCDTSHYNEEVNAVYAQCAQEAVTQLFPKIDAAETKVSTEVICDPVYSSEPPRPTDGEASAVIKYTAVCVLQEDLRMTMPSVPPNVLTASFGNGIRVPPTDLGTDTVPLPCAFGDLEGAAPLALGRSFRSPSMTPTVYISTLGRADICVVHVADTMLEQVIPTTSVQVNGVFIIHPQATKVPPKGESIVSVLEGLPIAAITAMAGPLSLVLAEIDHRRYFFRGVSWVGVDVHDLPFGADITESVTDEKLFGGVVKRSFPVFHDKASKCVFYNGEAFGCSNPEVVITLLNAPFEILETNRREITALVTQLQVVLNSIELESVTTPFLKHLSSIVDAYLLPLTDRIRKVISSGDTDAILVAARECNTAKRDFRLRMQWLTDLIGNAISVKKSSSKGHDLNRLKRKATIHSNVADAKAMTLASLGALLDKACDPDIGCVIAHVNMDALPPMLEAISASKFNAVVHTLSSVVTLKGRMLCIDPVTVSAIQEACPTTVMHSRDGSLSLALQGVDDMPAIPLPMLQRYVNATDPSKFQWVEECNDPTVAQLRILLRQTIATSTASRTMNILPQAKDLGLGIVYFVLDTMRALMQSPPPASVEDTRCQMMRGLFGFLLSTLASGANPMSSAWQLVGANPNLEVPPLDTLWIYAGVAGAFPYTLWDSTFIVRNIRRLVVRILRKVIVEPALEPMRKQAAESKTKKTEEFIEARKKDLRFLQIATAVVCRVHEMPPGDARDASTVAIGTHMLALMDHMGLQTTRSGGCAQLRKFFKGMTYGDLSSLDDALQTAVNIGTKRSSCFKAPKSSMVENAQGPEVLTAVKTQLAQGKGAGIVIRVQNEDAFLSGDKTKMRGDAELRRNPWDVCIATDNMYPEEVVVKTVSAVMSGAPFHGATFDTVSKTGSTQKRDRDRDVRALSDEDHPLIQTFSAELNHELAVGLVKAVIRGNPSILELLEIEKKMSPIHVREVRSMLEFSGVCGGKDQDGVCGRIVLCQLSNWKDTASAEAQVILEAFGD